MRALEGLPEVENVRFDPKAEIFALNVRKIATLSKGVIERTITQIGETKERRYKIVWKTKAVKATRGLPDKAVGFMLPTLEGASYDFGAVLKKKPAVVVFWASWCTACVNEVPTLKKLYAKYKETVEFVSVSIDDRRDHETLRALVKKLEVPYPVALDPKGKTIRTYTDRGAIPLTLFIDRAGTVIDHAGNFQKGDEHRLVLAVERIAN